MTTEQRRKEFEEWANLKDYSTAQYKDSDEYVNDDTTTAWEAWQAAIQKEQDEYCPLSDPSHPHGIRFREDSPTPTQTLSKKEKPEIINARLFDLCRYQRSELLEAELITDEEYMFLMHDCPLAQGSGSPSPRRLENYDKIREELTAAREELKAVTEQRDAALKQTIYCNADRIAKIRTEDNLAKVTEQRDRLAEALRKAISWGDSASHHILHRQNINWTYLNQAKEALQYLNQPNAVKGASNE